MEIITAYRVIDDLLKALSIRADPQLKMNDAEVMTTAVAATGYFGGNYEKSREFLTEHGYIPNMPGKSQLNRRLNRIDESVWHSLLFISI